MKNKNFKLFQCLFLFAAVFSLIVMTNSELSGQSIQNKKHINIAVVRDGPTFDSEITELIKPELTHLLGGDYSFSFIESDEFNAQWEPNKFRSVVQNALSDDTVDIILGVGAMVTQEAASDDLILTKPFVSTTILNGEIPPLPYSKKDRSLKENLALLILPPSGDKDFEEFNKLVKIDTIYMGIPTEEFNYLKNFSIKLADYEKEVGIKLIPQLISNDVQKTISEFKPGIKAFYLLGTPRLNSAERKEIIDYLTNRKIPVFSGLGEEDIELGVFATNKPNMSQEISRRSAVNLFRLIRGEKTTALPVFLISDYKLLINGKTAALIGYHPNYNIRLNSTILNSKYLEGEVREINLKTALKMAEEGNTSLSIGLSQVETSLQESKVARGFMFPQLGIQADYNLIDWNKLNELVPRNFANYGIGIKQMVFDDEVISNFSITGRKFEATEFKFESQKLDVYLQAAQSYLNFVQSRLYHQVVLDNLRLTEGNLKIAKMRVNVGQAGKDEIYRWQSEVANRKSAVLVAESAIEAARISLNQVLGLSQNINWNPEEIKVDPDKFNFLDESLHDVFLNPDSLKKFMGASIKNSLEDSPELQFLSKTIEAQKTQIGKEKRSFFIPKIYADFGYGNNFWQHPDVPTLDKSGFTVGVSAFLPIFQGTSRLHRVQREESVLKELNSNVSLTEELIEQRTRTAVTNLESSFPNISLSKTAAENARLNLEVVREKYANGIAGITDLLVAQNSTFIADQNAITAIYAFLKDLVLYQRAISFFVDTKTREEIDEFIEKFNQSMNQ